MDCAVCGLTISTPGRWHYFCTKSKRIVCIRGLKVEELYDLDVQWSGVVGDKSAIKYFVPHHWVDLADWHPPFAWPPLYTFQIGYPWNTWTPRPRANDL